MTDTDAGEARTTDLARTEDAELAEFYDYAKSLAVEDDAAVQERILRNLLRATTREDIINSGSAIKAEQVYDVPIKVLDIRASDSEYNEGPEQYLHIDCQIVSNGDRLTVACGARDVVMKLVRLHQLGLLPAECVIYRSTKQTKDGYYPVFLRLPEPAF